MSLNGRKFLSTWRPTKNSKSKSQIYRKSLKKSKIKYSIKTLEKEKKNNPNPTKTHLKTQTRLRKQGQIRKSATRSGTLTMISIFKTHIVWEIQRLTKRKGPQVLNKMRSQSHKISIKKHHGRLRGNNRNHHLYNLTK